MFVRLTRLSRRVIEQSWANLHPTSPCGRDGGVRSTMEVCVRIANRIVSDSTGRRCSGQFGGGAMSIQIFGGLVRFLVEMLGPGRVDGFPLLWGVRITAIFGSGNPPYRISGPYSVAMLGRTLRFCAIWLLVRTLPLLMVVGPNFPAAHGATKPFRPSVFQQAELLQ